MKKSLVYVNLSEMAYMVDEPLILVLAIYSRLRNPKLKYAVEQLTALDQFDRMLKMPAIKGKAI